MMTENLRYFQAQMPTFDCLVNATEFRTMNGNKYTVTIIKADGHHSIPLSSREDAIECADNYIREFARELAKLYGVL